MIRKRLPLFVLSAAVLAGGSSSAIPTPETTTAAVEATLETGAEITRESAGAPTVTASSEAAGETTADPYANLILNQYEGLEMTAAILPRNAIIPGITVPVTIVITNNGEQSISYVQGSGSFSTPQALQIAVDGLQTILPEDYLGAALMNYVVRVLKPGEYLQFTMNVKTVEPNDNFDNYTYNLYRKEQTYIGNLDILDLYDRYPDLTPAGSGSYEGVVSFMYRIIEGDQDTAVFGDATGYIQAPVTIFVTE
ncbi:MAG: hypothetical protein ACRDBO_07260 [Lachnospiraceae bacterium]